MLNFYVNLALLVIVVAGIVYLMLKIAKFNKTSILIIISLIVFWALMFMQKKSPQNEIKITRDLGPWAWPIIVSLYQLTQAATRLPYGKLSQKLKSRSDIIKISFIFVLSSLVIMISSNLSTWSLVIAAIAMGQFGSLFGLDAQYISENYNIKKVFTSASITFIIPVLSSLIASTIYGGFSINSEMISQNTYYWIICSVLIIGFLALISYSFIKEDKTTIRLDNIDASTKVFVTRGIKDVAAVSITGGFLTFTFNFTLSFGTILFDNLNYWTSVIAVSGLGASILFGLVLKKHVTGKFIRRFSLLLLSFATIITGILLISGYMSFSVWILLMIVAAIAFGLYIMALFGAALHFDHKSPILVLGVFLSVKSFASGSSSLAAGLIPSFSNRIIGVIILSVSIIGVISTILATMFIVDRFKNNDIDILINDSIRYEHISKKIVVSKKIV